MRVLIFCILSMTFSMLKAQNTPWPSSGNVGIGTLSPSATLEVKTTTGNNNNEIISASGFSADFDINRVYNPPIINSQIGLANGYGGLTYYHDGNCYGMALTSLQKIVLNYGQSSTSRFLRLFSPETNLANYSLQFSTQPVSQQSSVWYWKGGATIAALRQPLNIGSGSIYPVRIYSDGGNANKVADIFIQYSKVGIGTETPNANAKLDVNGNIYSNGKVFIGTPDGNTANQIAPYSLAVNGSAIFTKAIVKLNTNWPDYVFHKEYKLPTLNELEEFIKLNGHLPEVPKAEEIEKNGIDLGNNQTLLLKKIEELTLIVIEQNKRTVEQNKSIQDLKKVIQKISDRIDSSEIQK